MMREPKFCVDCGVQLSEGFLGFSPQYYNFIDGPRCQKCAKNKVEKARKNN